jgi:hypothetical protein
MPLVEVLIKGNYLLLKIMFLWDEGSYIIYGDLI